MGCIFKAILVSIILLVLFSVYPHARDRASVAANRKIESIENDIAKQGLEQTVRDYITTIFTKKETKDNDTEN
jgi:hypothetical protein